MDKSLTFKQQDEIVNYIIRLYKKADSRIKLEEMIKSDEKSRNISKNDLIMIKIVSDALFELNEDYQRIIQNDYIIKQKPIWIYDYYTKSTYYRLKHKAIEEFLHCLNA